MRRALSAVNSALGCPPAWPPRSLTALLLAFGTGAQAEVYHWLDADGLPVFSDAPPAGTAAVALRQGPANVYATPLALVPDGDADAGDEAVGVDESYVSAHIVVPAADAAVRANGGELTVRGQVSPPLRDGHRAVLFLDGAAQGQASGAGDAAVAFTVANVARGRHQAHIEVVDGNGDTLLRGAPSVFHVQRVALRR